MPDLYTIIDQRLARSAWNARRDHSDEDKRRTVAAEIARDIADHLGLHVAPTPAEIDRARTSHYLDARHYTLAHVDGDHIAKGG